MKTQHGGALVTTVLLRLPTLLWVDWGWDEAWNGSAGTTCFPQAQETQCHPGIVLPSQSRGSTLGLEALTHSQPAPQSARLSLAAGK